MHWRRRDQREQELDRELRDHLDLEAAERHKSGLTPREAHFAALRNLGNTSFIREATRDAWGVGTMDKPAQDFRYAYNPFSFNVTAVSNAERVMGVEASADFFDVLGGEDQPGAEPSWS